jgi:hypothetical protein
MPTALDETHGRPSRRAPPTRPGPALHLLAVSTLALGLALSITTRRTLAFLVVGLLANWGPAMRAAHVDPAAILED